MMKLPRYRTIDDLEHGTDSAIHTARQRDKDNRNNKPYRAWLYDNEAPYSPSIGHTHQEGTGENPSRTNLHIQWTSPQREKFLRRHTGHTQTIVPAAEYRVSAACHWQEASVGQRTQPAAAKVSATHGHRKGPDKPVPGNAARSCRQLRPKARCSQEVELRRTILSHVFRSWSNAPTELQSPAWTTTRRGKVAQAVIFCRILPAFGGLCLKWNIDSEVHTHTQPHPSPMACKSASSAS